MKAVLIAGGLGTRLRPVTYEIPKPLIPIQGKPLVEHIIELLKVAGVNEVYLSIGYKAEMIQAHMNSKKLGVKIHYLVEKEALGTGGWMHLQKLSGDFFVLNADNLFAIDFKKMLEQHKKSGAAVTIGLTEVQDVRAFGIADLDGDKIIGFVEKPNPAESPSNFGNSGYYIFNEKVFKFLPNEKSFMLEKSLFPVLARNNLLFGFKSSSQWFDTGTFESWEKAINEWKR